MMLKSLCPSRSFLLQNSYVHACPLKDKQDSLVEKKTAAVFLAF